MQLDRHARLFSFVIIITSALFVGASKGAVMTVGHNHITPTANVSSTGPDFPIGAISDGITNEADPSGLNGFVSASFGIISLSFDQAYDLTSFLLWNDVNLDGGGSEGIDQFSLAFFDSDGAPIMTSAATTYAAPLEQLTAQEYVFAAPVVRVGRVDLEVISSQWSGSTRIEIREVDFGVVPEPASALSAGIAMAGFGFRRRKS